MPKRRGAPRGRGGGGGRGGRGGGRGGGQFRFTRGKKNKGNSNSRRSQNETTPGYDTPELMDLDDNVYIPEIGKNVASSSMRNLSRRPARSRMLEEARYTDKHMEQTVKEPLRKRPIEFVKAKEVYDPSADLFRKMSKKDAPHGDLVDGMNSLNVEPENSPQVSEPSDHSTESPQVSERSEIPLSESSEVSERSEIPFAKSPENVSERSEKLSAKSPEVSSDRSEAKIPSAKSPENVSERSETLSTKSPDNVSSDRSKTEIPFAKSPENASSELISETEMVDDSEKDHVPADKDVVSVEEGADDLSKRDSDVDLSKDDHAGVDLSKRGSDVESSKGDRLGLSKKDPSEDTPAVDRAAEATTTSLSPPPANDASDPTVSTLPEAEEPRHAPIPENEPFDIIIDTEGDKNIHSSINVSKPPISALLNQKSHPQLSEAVPGTQLEYDPTITVGKVTLHTTQDALGNTSTQIMTSEQRNRVTKGFVDERRTPLHQDHVDQDENESDDHDDNIANYKSYISSIMNDMSKDNSDYDDDDVYESETNFDIMASSSDDDDDDEEESEASDAEETKDPEYGFLPEDYEFDVSQIAVNNVRFGLQNQYYTKNFELTGSTSDFVWVDEDDLFDFVSSKGVKEHRLQSFMKFITKGLIDDEEFEQPNYSDVYISETSDEDGSDISQDGEDLETLIKHSKAQQQRQQDLDQFGIPPTRSLQTSGKGKKKHLVLDDSDLDMDMREALQEQYQIHREAKRNKKNRKDDDRIQNGLARYDLTIKYPYSLHIKDIRDEFESFLHNPNRHDMSFPPLDPHGNKVVSKMASSYNMKSSKNGGNGLKSFIKVTKNRKTFHHLPSYNQIGSLLKQRPIFNRVDVKRPKGEIVNTDGNKHKDKERRRNKPENKAILREGDVVGSDAPEISRNNIGRQLLEKLGWTQGEGLGAHGNKGISEPVVATVKKSKTGLK